MKNNKRAFIPREVLVQKILIEHLPDIIIATQLNTITGCVKYWRYKYKLPGVRKRTIYWDKKQPLDEWVTGAVIGTVLGDGCLAKNKLGDVFLLIHHCAKQKEFVEYKRKLFDSFTIMPVKFALTNFGHGSFKFSTLTHPTLKDLYSKIYIDGKKRISKEILEHLTLLGFALWYMDDGYKETETNDYYICTHSFSLEDQKIIRDQLRRKFDIWTTIQKVGKYYKLYICRRSKEQFEKLIIPFIISCMEYKLRTSALQRLHAENTKVLRYSPDPVEIQGDKQK